MYLDSIIKVRLREKEIKEILKIISYKNDKYDNMSHFIRCAIIKLIKEEKNKKVK